MIDKKLAAGKYSAVTLVYSETSTGLINPVYEISEMIRKKYPDVLVFVDAVSGMIGMPLHFDKLGWDVALSSVQRRSRFHRDLRSRQSATRNGKEQNRAPAAAIISISRPLRKSHEKNQTPTTPAIPHIMALNYQCKKLPAEGMENVWARHKKMADFVRSWAKEKFALFCDEKYASNTLTTIKNTRGIKVGDVIAPFSRNTTRSSATAMAN